LNLLTSNSDFKLSELINFINRIKSRESEAVLPSFATEIIEPIIGMSLKIPSVRILSIATSPSF